MIVVCYHCQRDFRFPTWTGDFFSNGYEAVSFFFVLSGFILTYVYAADAEHAVDRRRFWAARVARICPVYYLALLLDLPRLLYSAWFVGNTTKPRFALAAVSTPLFLQSWIPSAEDVWNVPAWSLSVEAFFYLLFPFLVLPLRRTRAIPLLVAAFTLSVIVGSLRMIIFTGESGLGSTVRNMAHFSPLLHLPQFILGIAVASTFLTLPRLGSTTAEILLIAAGLVVIAMFWSRSRLPSLATSDAVLAPLYGILIYAAAQAVGPLTGTLSHRTLVWLGEISYGIYIFHIPLFFLCMRASDRLLHLSPTIRLWGFMAGLLIFCSLVYRFVEKPCRFAISHWLNRKDLPVGVLAQRKS